MRSVGPTPRVLVYRCRTYSAPFPTSIRIDSPSSQAQIASKSGLPCQVSHLRRSSITLHSHPSPLPSPRPKVSTPPGGGEGGSLSHTPMLSTSDYPLGRDGVGCLQAVVSSFSTSTCWCWGCASCTLAVRHEESLHACAKA